MRESGLPRLNSLKVGGAFRVTASNRLRAWGLTFCWAAILSSPAGASEDFCRSPGFRRAFVTGSPVERYPPGALVCDMRGPNTAFLRDGDSAIPCLAGIVEGKG